MLYNAAFMIIQTTNLHQDPYYKTHLHQDPYYRTIQRVGLHVADYWRMQELQ